MSFEEPKAPIVRIRKKHTKKKSKDNDIVHLPVRASQQARYSSLVTPRNPQTKGRECCRVFFAGCMKVPICRLVCFRCILPKCYSGEDSDEEDTKVKDEGYHSQNRRSSEVTPNPECGAQGGAQPQNVEMTEIKSETVTLIPPPRSIVNEYRNDPCKSEDSDDENGEVTYIEVESMTLTDSDAALNIPERDRKCGDTSTELKRETLETGYEEPVHAGVLNFPEQKLSEKDKSSQLEDCDDSDDAESRIYVNESVLGTITDTDEEKKSNSDKSYINVGPSEKYESNYHSKPKLDKPHEYVNLSSVNAVEKLVNDKLDDTKISFGTAETMHGAMIKDNKKDTEKILHNIVRKVEHVSVKPDYHDAQENIVNEKDLEVGDSDAGRLLKTNKENVLEADTYSKEDMDETAEQDLTSDQTKLL